MTTFLENPVPVIFIGIVVEAVLVSVYINTRRNLLLLPMIAVPIAVLVGVGLERVVVTEKEEVEATLDGAADALENDDQARLFHDYVSPSARQTRSRAETAMDVVRITQVKIRNLEITINHLTSPPTAEARFDVVVYFVGRQHGIGRDRYPAKFVVELRREGDRWMISDHVEYELQSL